MAQASPVGCHLRKEPAYDVALQALVKDMNGAPIAYQIFAAGPRTAAPTMSAEELTALVNATRKSHAHALVHGSYITTLRSQTSAAKLRPQLAAARELGSPGVVVHTSKINAAETAAAAVALAHAAGADSQCRVLIEPTGVRDDDPPGTAPEAARTYADIPRLAALGRAVAAADHNGAVGFVLDTAHVWATNADAANFLPDEAAATAWTHKLDTDAPEFVRRIRAIHFNGSYSEAGSGLDKHAIPGIQEDQIWHGRDLRHCGVAAIVRWAASHGLPLVVEANQDFETLPNVLETIAALAAP